MTDEKKQEYTLRITQANPSKLVVILYEMFFDFAQEAQEALNKQNRGDFYSALDKAQQALSQLIGSLNFDQDPAESIYRVYLYVSASMGVCRGKLQFAQMQTPLRLMRSLYDTYKTDSACDTRGPVMDNTQKVYAGLTYSKNSLTENMEEGAGSRGFFV